MSWLIVLMAVCLALALAYRYSGPRVPDGSVAGEDLDLVRESDRAGWRRTRMRSYRLAKRQDDFYRLAAYRKLVKGGATAEEARARVRKDYPFYYLNPADREAGGHSGDDAGLPVALRARVNRNARLLKQLMESEGERFRSMNALIRTCIRKEAF